MASTERLDSGRFRGLYRANGKRQRVKGTFADRFDALHAAQEAEVVARRRAPTQQGTYDPRMTWRDWHAVWWPTRDLAETTARVEATMVDSLVMPAFGDQPLNAITRAAIQSWLGDLTKRTSAAHARRAYSPLHASFKSAVELDVLTADPCAGVRRPVVRSKGRRHMSASTILAVRGHLSDLHRDCFDVLLDTGMRPGELMGLHRHSVVDGWVKIEHTLPSTTHTIVPPKDKDVRDVPLTDRAQAVIDRWLKIPPHRSTCGLRHADGRPCRSDLVVRQSNRKPLNVTTLQAAVKRAGLAAGIKGCTTYQLRHSYGTKLAGRNVDPWTIARLMGHATLEQATTYVHESDHMADQVRAALRD